MDDIKKFEPFWDSWYVTGELGEGGFGKVYKIERTEFGNVYTAALKHIHVPQVKSEIKSVMADGMDRASVEEYFESTVKDIVGEFVLMSKLKGNSNIVSYEDHKVIKAKDTIGWDIFIRMELLTNLLDHIREKEISRKDVIKLGIDMCKALELCQKYNIIHRDIKPENIFISDSGEYKLGDFGIARQAEKTMAGLSKKGTFTYIAPEIYKGEAYGSSVDVYSLGLVMYRLLNNNRMPFMPPYPKPITYSDREKAMVKRIGGQAFPEPINAGGRLAEIILKACSYEPKERYSPLQMRMELETILYSDAEGRLIYPNGDKADIKSLRYVGNGSEATEIMISEEQPEYSAFDGNRKTEENSRTLNKKYILCFAGVILLLIAGISLKLIDQKNTVEEKTINYVSTVTETFVSTEAYTETVSETVSETISEAPSITKTTQSAADEAARKAADEAAKKAAADEAARKAADEAARKAAADEAARKAADEAARKAAADEAARKAADEAARKAAADEAARKAADEAARKAAADEAARKAADEAARKAAADEAARKAAEEAQRVADEVSQNNNDEAPQIFMGFD